MRIGNVQRKFRVRRTIVHVDAENELVGFAFYGWMSTRRRNSGEPGRALANGLQAAGLSDNVEK